VTDTFIQLPTDGAGKKHRSWENTVGSDDVHATAGVITAPDGTVLSDTNGVEVNGNVASGAADAGNPVKAGGVYNATLPTLTDGQRGDLQVTAGGELLAYINEGWVSLQDASGNLLLFEQNNADGTPTGRRSVPTRSHLYLFNGTTFDRATGDSATGQDVDVTRLPALPAGTNNIGTVSLPAAATATLSNVATSTTSAQLLASNASRKGAIIYNDSLVVMYVKFGTTASATSFSYYLAAGATLELPSSPVYTGRIDAILASSTGTARVTELT
jgi:hypothetical protein